MLTNKPWHGGRLRTSCCGSSPANYDIARPAVVAGEVPAVSLTRLIGEIPARLSAVELWANSGRRTTMCRGRWMRPNVVLSTARYTNSPRA